MTRKIIQILTAIMIVLFLFVGLANAENDPQRDYTFIVTPNYKMDLVSVNSWSLNRLFQDAYTNGIGPQIENKTAR